METITSSRDIDALFREGRRSRRASMIVLCRANAVGPDGQRAGRVVFVAGKKLGGAVLRNRCKRVMRASVARSGVEWPGHDVALIACEKTATTPAEKLDGDLRAAVDELGVGR